MPELFTPQLLDDAQGDPGREGPNALTTGEATQGLLDDGPQLSTTRTALPIGGAPGGDGTAQSAPQPPEAPDFPRMDVPTDAPERDQDARRQDRIMALLGALGATAAAAGDDPVMLSAAGGLAQGASQDLQRRKKTFAERQQAFQEMVTEAEKHNRRVRQKEIEADYERRLSAFEQDRKDRRQRAQATQDRIEAEREHERTLKEIKARGQQRRSTNRQEARLDNSTTEEGPSQLGDRPIPDDPRRAQDLLNQVDQEIQALENRRGDFTETEMGPFGGRTQSVSGQFQDEMAELVRYRAALQQAAQQSGPGENGQGGPLPGGGEPSGDRSRRHRKIGAGQEGFAQPDSTNRDAPARDTTTTQNATRGSQNDGRARKGQQDGYVNELNQTLRREGRRAALLKLADDREAGRLTPRQAQAYYEQIAPDSLLQR